MFLPTTYHLPHRTPGSYLRGAFRADVLAGCHQYRDVALTISKKTGGTTTVRDGTADALAALGLIPEQTRGAYLSAVAAAFPHVDTCNDLYLEQVHHRIEELRLAHFGPEALEALRQSLMDRSTGDLTPALDQRAMKQTLTERHSAFLLCLTDPTLLAMMAEDVKALLAAGKAVYILTDSRPGHILPTRQALAGRLPGGVILTEDPPETDCLLCYGEEGFLSCRSLKVPAFVQGTPTGFFTKAVTGQLTGGQACAVYIPGGLDITRTVPILDRTRISYAQYARLCRDHGEGIYALAPEELYRRYPQYFFNIYDDGTPTASVSLPPPEDMAHFDALREEAIFRHLNSLPGLSYCAAYFDDDMDPAPLAFDGEKQPGILVHTAKVSRSAGAEVLSCGGKSPRLTLNGRPGTAIVSNFLFFMTDKLGALYDRLRADRPREQTKTAGEHLDFRLDRDRGVCTFPLFAKACIGMTEGGQFLSFRFRLQGGSVTLGGHTLRWEAENVDGEGPIRVFTPMLSQPDRDADRDTYRKTVGEGRVNFIIIQDRLTCIRKGDVILPSVGVVVSVEEALAQPILASLTPLEDGYYAPDLALTVELDAPAELTKAQWQSLRWAWGGGMTLMAGGEDFWGDPEGWFDAEGWMSPLSRQTQESALHKLVKHPRTAVGVTESGELVVLVFSGRTWRSTGADYEEMVCIARKLYPDIRDLMNVDGGGSAMLGMLLEGRFHELSFPSTSTGSCVGMTRPVNTVLYIPVSQDP